MTTFLAEDFRKLLDKLDEVSQEELLDNNAEKPIVDPKTGTQNLTEAKTKK